MNGRPLYRALDLQSLLRVAEPYFECFGDELFRESDLFVQLLWRCSNPYRHVVASSPLSALLRRLGHGSHLKEE